jgi:hypothetical protein
MKKVVLGITTAALVALPAAAAPAAEIPEVNCGIVSCTYQVEQAVNKAEDCVNAAEYGLRNALNGTPQPGTC